MRNKTLKVKWLSIITLIMVISIRLLTAGIQDTHAEENHPFEIKTDPYITDQAYRVKSVEMETFVGYVRPTPHDTEYNRNFFREKCFFISMNGEDITDIRYSTKFTLPAHQVDIDEDNTVAVNKIFGDFFKDGIAAHSTLTLPMQCGLSVITNNVHINIAFDVGFILNLEVIQDYKIEYYKDEISNDNLILTAGGKFHPLETILTKEIVDKDMGETWLDSNRPDGYQNGFVVNYPSIGNENNVVKVLYLKNKYLYTVAYYADSVTGSNLIEKVFGSPKDLGTLLDFELVRIDLGDNWIDAKKPVNYQKGTVVQYPVIDIEENENLIHVVYQPGDNSPNGNSGPKVKDKPSAPSKDVSAKIGEDKPDEPLTEIEEDHLIHGIYLNPLSMLEAVPKTGETDDILNLLIGMAITILGFGFTYHKRKRKE